MAQKLRNSEPRNCRAVSLTDTEAAALESLALASDKASSGRLLTDLRASVEGFLQGSCGNFSFFRGVWRGLEF